MRVLPLPRIHLTQIISAFHPNHSSSLIWLALAQDLRQAKKPCPLARVSPGSTRSSPEVTVEARLALARTSGSTVESLLVLLQRFFGVTEVQYSTGVFCESNQRCM